MWFNSDIFDRIQTTAAPIHGDTELQQRRTAMEEIEKTGRGVCAFCGEDIVRNDAMNAAGWSWESESLVGFCDKSPQKAKHSPLLKWKPEEEVSNVEPEPV